MNITQISPNIIQKKKIAFKSTSNELDGNNLDDFLKKNNLNLQKTYGDLIEIKEFESKDKNVLSTLKRIENNKNKLSEYGIELPKDFFKLFEDDEIYNIIKESQNKESLGLISKIADECELNKINYKREVLSFAKDVDNVAFTNTIKIPEIKKDVFDIHFSQNTIADIHRIFFEFKDSDTNLMKKSNTAFVNTSKNYLEFISQSIKNIKDMHTNSQKWTERIPVIGALPRIGRVANQQECAKYLYETHNAYCNMFVHNGIRPIALAYKEKLKQTQNYIDLASSYLNYRENEYVNTAMTNMKKLAEPELNRYKQILSTFANNSKSISAFYKAINNSGDISSLIKTARTIVFLGF